MQFYINFDFFCLIPFFCPDCFFDLDFFFDPDFSYSHQSGYRIDLAFSQAASIRLKMRPVFSTFKGLAAAL